MKKYIFVEGETGKTAESPIEKMDNGKQRVGEATLQAMMVVAKTSAQSLPDTLALQAAALYDDFEYVVGQTVDQGFKFRYDGKVWKTIQPKTIIQSIYPPGVGTESLYAVINETNAGTISDPIPAQANMEYEYGKYYSENSKVYLCRRGGLSDEQAQAMYGQKITLQFLPSQLIGQYFEIVL